MSVVVTGLTSFVGHHLALSYAAAGRRVIGTLTREPDLYAGVQSQRLATLAGLVSFQVVDLRDQEAVAALVERSAPSLWIHHAGHAARHESHDYDFDLGHAVNVAPLGPLYASLAGRACGVIVTGSSAEYGRADRPNREDDACLPDTPYGLSKMTETLRARQLAEQWGVPTRVARLYIPFGVLDNPNKVLPQVVASLQSGRPISLSPCLQRRDFVGIDDICSGYHRLEADLPRALFDVFNIASGESVILRDLLGEIADRLGAARSLLRFGEIAMRPNEPTASVADVSKARRVLKWAATPLSAAIERDLLGASRRARALASPTTPRATP